MAWQLIVDMAPDCLRHDKYYDPEQNIWTNAVKIGDQYNRLIQEFINRNIYFTSNAFCFGYKHCGFNYGIDDF